MVNRSQMRAGDSDRERVAEILRDAHTEGRLGQEELLERVEATYSARTFNDLDRLIEDLPIDRRPANPIARMTTPRSAPVPVNRPNVGRRIARGFLTTSWWIYFGVLAIVMIVWVSTNIGNGEWGNFWPGWVAGPWGAVLGTGELAYRAATGSKR